MRIAFVSTYPPIECGIGTYTQYLTDALKLHQKEVHIISQQGAAGKNVHPVYDPNSNTIAKDIFIVAARISPDVVHIEHEFGLFGDQKGIQVVELVLRLKMMDIPCVITMHTVNAVMSSEQEIILQNLVRECDKVIVHEDYQKQILLDKFKLIDNIEVIPHGVRNISKVSDSKSLIGVEDKKVLLLAGFFRRTKNFEQVVSIFPRILKKVPEACLLIAGKSRGIGNTDYVKSLFSQINKSPSQKDITVLRGQFPQKTFDTILSSADVMAFPYTAGAQSGVMAHSAAFNIPLVTSGLKSFANWNKKSKGGITAKTDTEFVNGIVKLFKDQKFYKKCQNNISKFIQPILWENVSRSHIYVYEKVIKIPYGKARYFDLPES